MILGGILEWKWNTHTVHGGQHKDTPKDKTKTEALFSDEEFWPRSRNEDRLVSEYIIVIWGL